MALTIIWLFNDMVLSLLHLRAKPEPRHNANSNSTLEIIVLIPVSALNPISNHSVSNWHFDEQAIKLQQHSDGEYCCMVESLCIYIVLYLYILPNQLLIHPYLENRNLDKSN